MKSRISPKSKYSTASEFFSLTSVSPPPTQGKRSLLPAIYPRSRSLGTTTRASSSLCERSRDRMKGYLEQAMKEVEGEMISEKLTNFDIVSLENTKFLRDDILELQDMLRSKKHTYD